jgi:hypothetical protein
MVVIGSTLKWHVKVEEMVQVDVMKGLRTNRYTRTEGWSSCRCESEKR